MPRNEKKKWVVFTFHTPMLVRKFFPFWDPKSLSRRNIQCMVFVRPGMLCLSPFSRVLHSQQSTLTLSHTHSLSPLPLFGHFKILLHLLVYYIYIYIYISIPLDLSIYEILEFPFLVCVFISLKIKNLICNLLEF